MLIPFRRRLEQELVVDEGLVYAIPPSNTPRSRRLTFEIAEQIVVVLGSTSSIAPPRAADTMVSTNVVRKGQISYFGSRYTAGSFRKAILVTLNTNGMHDSPAKIASY